MKKQLKYLQEHNFTEILLACHRSKILLPLAVHNSIYLTSIWFCFKCKRHEQWIMHWHCRERQLCHPIQQVRGNFLVMQPYPKRMVIYHSLRLVKAKAIGKWGERYKQRPQLKRSRLHIIILSEHPGQASMQTEWINGIGTHAQTYTSEYKVQKQQEEVTSTLRIIIYSFWWLRLVLWHIGSCYEPRWQQLQSFNEARYDNNSMILHCVATRHEKGAAAKREEEKNIQ